MIISAVVNVTDPVARQADAEAFPHESGVPARVVHLLTIGRKLR